MRIFNLVLVVALMMFALSSYALAARHSTAEEMQYALNESIHTIRKTDDYKKGITNSPPDYRVLLVQLKICESEYEKIKSTREAYVALGIGKEASECLGMAQLIVGYRMNTLGFFKAAVESQVKNNEEDFRYYIEKAVMSSTNAEKYRVQFKEDYGY